MKITRAVVPSLFTVLNMFSGFMSILHASRGEFIAASWFIALAAGFDALDGVMARITKSSSQFGVEIDSLSDVVSFGAAPAFLVYQMDLHRLEGVGVVVSSLLMVFARPSAGTIQLAAEGVRQGLLRGPAGSDERVDDRVVHAELLLIRNRTVARRQRRFSRGCPRPSAC